MENSEIIIRHKDGEGTFDGNSLIEISNDFVTYRLQLNDKGQIGIVKVTANGLDTISVQPQNQNRILLF